jgi:PPOX class probable F420-dependent enzyme
VAHSQKDFADRSVVTWAARRCMLLITYRRDGRPVASPVWFVTDHTEIRLWTDSGAGKVKRLRRNPHCTIAPCTFSGRVTGEALGGEARILPDSEGRQVQALLRAKYPIQKRALNAYNWLRRGGAQPASPGPSTYLAISISG